MRFLWWAEKWFLHGSVKWSITALRFSLLFAEDAETILTSWWENRLLFLCMFQEKKKKSHKQFCTYSLFKKIWKQRNFVFFRMLQLQSQAVNFGGKVALCIQTMNKLWFQYEMRTILCSKTDFFRFTSIHDQWAVLPLRMK